MEGASRASRRGEGERRRQESSFACWCESEIYADWYLRSLGYVFIARNYEPSHAERELDLVGFGGETLAFVEVRTRELASGKSALPALSITRGKHKVLIRPANCRWRACIETRSVHELNPPCQARF
jgi:Holliday junction resolvase-like predicted endonuclease